MLFNSRIFLYLFLPITYFGFWRLKSNQRRYQWLTVASYIFYGYWNYKFCFWMLFSTAVSYFSGLGLLHYNDARRRRLCLILPIAIDLSVLGFFKYGNFTLHSVQRLLSVFGVPVHASVLAITLPIGISFYTFHTISYIVDSYRRQIQPTRDFWEFACYVSLFSQLVAGPIVRFRQVEDDLNKITKERTEDWLNKGWSFFAIGLYKKILIADTIALVIDPALKDVHSLSTPAAWLCMVGYAYQLYFDFSGYSDMAVGLGYMFGIRLPQNFNSPYKAKSIPDFWRRWHMSLSSCLRDYLYIPLGGNRGTAAFVVRNIMLTMLIGGLWHGANWTFVLWGAYHGILLVLFRYAPGWQRIPDALQTAGTFILTIIGWVFFRMPDWRSAVTVLQRMFSWFPGTLPVGTAILSGFLICATIIAHGCPNTFEIRHQWSRPVATIMTGLFVVCLLMFYRSNQSPFLYFQF